jgi:sec-independent protein translocase protein TatA
MGRADTPPMGEGLFAPSHLIVLAIILLLVFGPKRLPELGRSLGSGLRGFKDAISGDDDDDREPKPVPTASATQTTTPTTTATDSAPQAQATTPAPQTVTPPAEPRPQS